MNTNILINWLINTLVIMVASYLLPGITIDNFVVALLVAIVLAFLNTFIRPILIILTLPITLLTLGLFLLVINALLIMLTSAIVPGFHVNGFGWAILFSILVSIINAFIAILFHRHFR